MVDCACTFKSKHWTRINIAATLDSRCTMDKTKQDTILSSPLSVQLGQQRCPTGLTFHLLCLQHIPPSRGIRLGTKFYSASSMMWERLLQLLVVLLLLLLLLVLLS